LQIDTDLDADLLDVAEQNVRDCEFLRADLAAMLFPQSKQRLSEEMLAFIRRDSLSLSTGLAKDISGDGDVADHVTDLAKQRRFSADPALLEFFIARYSSCRLEKRLYANGDIAMSETLPARLLTEPDHHIAECGQIILATSGLRRRGGAAHWAELPSDLLHQAVWRMVADLESVRGDQSELIRANAQKLLAGHAESHQVHVAAQKFLHLSGGRYDNDLDDVGKSGLAIFVARISDKLKLTADHVLRLIDAPSLSACAILQRGLNIDEEQAMKNICLLYGFDLTPRDIGLFEKGYCQITPEQAAQAALGWHIERLQRRPNGAGLAGDAV